LALFKVKDLAAFFRLSLNLSYRYYLFPLFVSAITDFVIFTSSSPSTLTILLLSGIIQFGVGLLLLCVHKYLNIF